MILPGTLVALHAQRVGGRFTVLQAASIGVPVPFHVPHPWAVAVAGATMLPLLYHRAVAHYVNLWLPGMRVHPLWEAGMLPVSPHTVH